MKEFTTRTAASASHIIDEVLGVIATPPSMPESLPAEVIMHGVRYVGTLYPESAHMIVMSEAQFNALCKEAYSEQGTVQ